MTTTPTRNTDEPEKKMSDKDAERDRLIEQLWLLGLSSTSYRLDAKFDNNLLAKIIQTIQNH